MAGSAYSTSLGLMATSSSSLCGTYNAPFTTTINGITMMCTGLWSCCYTSYCNSCPPAGCTYASTGTGGTGGTSNKGNVLKVSASASLMLATILMLNILFGYAVNVQ